MTPPASFDGTPFPPPKYRSDLRQVRFRDVGDDVERWVWEKNATAWELHSTRPRAEYEAESERIREYARTHPIPPEDLERARRFIEERGW